MKAKSRHGLRKPTPGLRLGGHLTILACVFGLASCSTVEKVTKKVTSNLPQGVPTPVKYTLAGADTGVRNNLERGLTQLKGENYHGALASLNRAIWDLERIEKPWLRLDELAEAYEALANVYDGLRRPEWAEEHRRLAGGLLEQSRQAASGKGPQRSLEAAKQAYAAAQFREAVPGLRQALVDLEGLTEGPARIRRLEEPRCYLAFTYFALEDKDRAREEIQRLWARDSSVAACLGEAPPAIRELIGEVQRRSNSREKSGQAVRGASADGPRRPERLTDE